MAGLTVWDQMRVLLGTKTILNSNVSTSFAAETRSFKKRGGNAPGMRSVALLSFGSGGKMEKIPRLKNRFVKEEREQIAIMDEMKRLSKEADGTMDVK
ncbi:hypothetical protein J1N35_015236 [Gossypium stocksii]|uniref:Uncharacterized protein n=1 Tax=Gossypium stocksii TaxID=47602 RepID=A0A9D4A9P0_9ROSI|nr:hypothetical protein J1N35_015236 [Gossypium stocksii]